jgi:5-methylcytosine-specific restriction protein A
MQFIKGNLALREHMKSGKRIFLFTASVRSFVKYEGELELLEFDYFEGPDREGKERMAIKFFFKRFGSVIDYEADAIVSGFFVEPESEYTKSPSITEREGLVTSRVGQGAYRKSILFRWNFKCAVTNYSRNEILIASHIVPWKDSTNQERLDVNNGILLSPTYDALFDRRLVSFENNGKIILSEALAKSNYTLLGVNGKETIRNLSTENHSYLERHRLLMSG